MSKAARLGCYRVPLYRTGFYREPIIAAFDAQDAKERAQQLAEDMVRKHRADLPLEVGEPVLFHPRGRHP